MKIYPKTNCKLQGVEYLKPYIQKYKGIEIQILTNDDMNNLYTIVKQIKEKIPEIKEITIHPPLKDEYNFEVLTYRNLEKEEKTLKLIVKMSEEFNIKINLLYHTRWNYLCWKSSGEIEVLKELLKITENTNVNILLENIYSIVDIKNCAVLQIAKEINNEHLRVCLDICHLHCEANMFKIDLNEFLKNYLNKEDCKNYIYQIHFSGTLNNDGYVDRKTHGKKHDTIENFKQDYDILVKYGIENKIIVTEVGEENYSTRSDQIEEIIMLENL